MEPLPINNTEQNSSIFIDGTGLKNIFIPHQLLFADRLFACSPILVSPASNTPKTINLPSGIVPTTNFPAYINVYRKMKDSLPLEGGIMEI
jgi:hypothetical protein